MLQKRPFVQRWASLITDPATVTLSSHHRLLYALWTYKTHQLCCEAVYKMERGALNASQSAHHMVAEQLQEEKQHIFNEIPPKMRAKAFSLAGSRGRQHIINLPSWYYMPLSTSKLTHPRVLRKKYGELVCGWAFSLDFLDIFWHKLWGELSGYFQKKTSCLVEALCEDRLGEKDV